MAKKKYINRKNINGSNNQVNIENRDNIKEKGQYHNNERSGPSKWTELLLPIAGSIVAAVITALISVMVPNYFNNRSISEDNNVETPTPVPETVASPFYYDEHPVEHSQFEYVECTLTSDPVLPGYQVKPYPYIAVLGLQGWTYIPVIGLYTQEQYSADNEGICILERENIMMQLQDISTNVNKEIGNEYKVGCVLLIEYVTGNGLKQREIYELRPGNLTISETAESIKILNAYKNDKQIKINVITWPSNKEQIVEIIGNL